MRFLAMLIWLSLGATVANAQIAAPESGSGVQSQPDTAYATASGIKIEVVRLARVPKTQNFRLIMRVTDTGDKLRMIALVNPIASLTDDFGNQYIANGSDGALPICDQRDEYWGERCGSNERAQMFSMTKDLVSPAVLYVTPSETSIPELALEASSLTLFARIVVYDPDSGDSEYTDVVVNGIALPK